MKKIKLKANFKDRVLAIVARIPKGKVMTYGQVAKKAGNSKAARAVGKTMNNNRSAKIPCHRVVGTGWLGGYNAGVQKKKLRLKKEGVDIAHLDTHMI